MLFKNKRKHPRAESKTRLFVTCESGSFEGTILNISLSGLFAACDDLPPIGAMVEIEFQLPDSSLKVAIKGRIVRTVEATLPPRGIGVEFTDMDDQAVKLISSYVAKCQVSQR
jgi:Tfp pilus assembly protein PilZ